MTPLDREIAFHRRAARPGTLLDIGAHTGGFSKGILDGTHLDVVAVEPLPQAFENLAALAASAQGRLRAVNAALSDHEGTAALQIPLLGSGPVLEWASIAKDFEAIRRDHPEIDRIERIEVPLMTLDGLAGGSTPAAVALAALTAIKLDAEGAEYEILRGAVGLIGRRRPVLSVELEERHRVGCTYAVPAFLDALGYDAFFELDDRLVPMSRLDRATMHRGGVSPGDHAYSTPYIFNFYFLPREARDLRTKLFEAYGEKVGKPKRAPRTRRTRATARADV